MSGRIIAYARVSTDKQDAANQEFELRRYMDARGMTPDEVITEVVSGTVALKERRVGVLLDSLREGDTLIVAEISRLSRDMLTISSIIGQCLDKGANLIAVKEGWTLGSDPGSKFIAIAFGMAAEIERNFISQRTKEGLARRKAEGVILGRPHGSHRPEHRKLHGKNDQIMGFMEAHMSRASIARYYGVTRQTVNRFIDDEDLTYQLRSKQLREMMEREGTRPHQTS